MRKAIITCDSCGKEIATGKVGKTWHTITWHGGLTKMSKDICDECWDERLLLIKEEGKNKVYSADVVEVVRCKDCKKYRPDRPVSPAVMGDDDSFHFCCAHELYMFTSDYCSYGVKKDG